MQLNEKQMHECMQHCWEARHECQSVLFNHCIEVGGAHVAAEHVRIIADCIQACQTAADFMVRGSQFSASECATCAEICEACAESCARIEGEEMKQCAEICRRCAESCRKMSEIQNAA
ncbi:MAG: four-helix bundle copper-binding protein [Alphaproteobacteria bacterium]|nr:four-helix bundle copper-binding protein [Alphaproteobacteria bacterium]